MYVLYVVISFPLFFVDTSKKIGGSGRFRPKRLYKIGIHSKVSSIFHIGNVLNAQTGTSSNKKKENERATKLCNWLLAITLGGVR